MLKNGLCIVSIGMIFFLYSVNAMTGSVHWANLITSVTVILAGALIAWRGYVRDKKKGKSADGGSR